MSDKICQKCGANNPTWFADNELFNKVNGSPNGVLCPKCFQELADEKGLNVIFKADEVGKEYQIDDGVMGLLRKVKNLLEEGPEDEEEIPLLIDEINRKINLK